jgi:hypothetical protein
MVPELLNLAKNLVQIAGIEETWRRIQRNGFAGNPSAESCDQGQNTPIFLLQPLIDK